MPASRGMAARVILALLFAAGLLAAALVFFPAPQTRSLPGFRRGVAVRDSGNGACSGDAGGVRGLWRNL